MFFPNPETDQGILEKDLNRSENVQKMARTCGNGIKVWIPFHKFDGSWVKIHNRHFTVHFGI